MAPNIPEGPKFPRPMRVAAVIETAQGILLVQDWKDHFKKDILARLSEEYNKYIRKNRQGDADRKLAAMRIVSEGRFSLPGGKIELDDYKDAKELLGLPQAPRTPRERELFDQVVRKATIREVQEETGTLVDQSHIVKVLEIQGRTRDHIISLLRIEGELHLPAPAPGKEKEISSYGFLKRDNVTAMNSDFYQSHVRQIYWRYFLDSKDSTARLAHFMSRLRVPLEYVEQWQSSLLLGYANRDAKHQKKHSPLVGIQSSPNFAILDTSGNIHNPYQPRSLTTASRAIYVPREEGLPSSRSSNDNTKRRSSPPPPDSTPTKPNKPGLAKIHPRQAPSQKKKIEVL